MPGVGTIERSFLNALAARFPDLVDEAGGLSTPHSVIRFSHSLTAGRLLTANTAVPLPTLFSGFTAYLLSLPSLPGSVRDALALSVHVEGPDAGKSVVAGGGTLFLSALFQSIRLSLYEAAVSSLVPTMDVTPRSADFLRNRPVEALFATGGSVIKRPQDVSDSARDVSRMVRGFVEKEILPYWQRIEEGDLEFQKAIFRKAGEVGILGALIPAAYGGSDLGIEEWAALCEAIVSVDSMTTGLTGSMGIGNQAIVYFGSEDQKQHYLPAIASGDLIGVFALTEPFSGSDAFGSMKTTATESVRDGQRVWIVNGSKQFITNPAFDNSVMTVFAKVNGQVSAFIVETNTPGVKVGKPEDKLGQHGSNTCPVNFDEVVIPYDNLVGKVGEGKKIAMTTLNRGRLILGIASTAKAVHLTQQAVAYALERRQFGSPIAGFGLVQQHLLTMALNGWAAQRMSHRIIGDLTKRFEAIDVELEISQETSQDAASDNPERDRERRDRRAKALQEFELEFSILKILGSEAYHQAADHYVQVMGGYGYIIDYPAARALRDSRIGEIYEGTTEINQLRVAEGLLKLVSPKNPNDALVAGDRASEITGLIQALEKSYEAAHPLHTSARQTLRALEMAGAAYSCVSHHLESIADLSSPERQYFVNELSRMTIEAHRMDSALRATAKDVQQAPDTEDTQIALQATQLICNDSLRRMLDHLRKIREYLPQDGDWSALDESLYAHFPRLDRLALEKALVQRVIEQGHL